MRFGTVIKCLTAGLPLVGLAVGLNACSNETGDSTVTPEQGITQDISAVHTRRTTTLPASERPARQPAYWEPSGTPPTRWPSPSVSASIERAPTSGNPQSGHDFAIGTCTPCHFVSPDQKSPIRFAAAPDFRAIANAPGTTAIGLNIWLTNPHPTMPKLVLHPQEATDVIAYILSLRQQR